ncbi:MAG: polysaccharide biosynthesis protein [Clostridia bacterium]|nr:polysaccharide biosynthesis protein [Clostridia bacterium]
MAEKEIKKRRWKLEHWQQIAVLLAVYDVFAVNLSYLAALWLRFDFKFSNIIGLNYTEMWLRFIPIYTVVCLVVFWLFRLYQSLWRFASYTELRKIIFATIVTTVFHTAAITVILGRMPISYYLMGAVIQFVLVLGIRFSYRFVLLLKAGRRTNREKRHNIMLIGAGEAGQMILRDLMSAKESNDKVRCIIDDNSNKWNRFIDGVRVVGGRETIIENAKKFQIDKIYMAIPTATAQQRRDILDICKETGCEVKNLPGMYQLASGEVTVQELKDVDIEDLLGREPIKVNLEEIFRSLTGKVIMVTGGGGSIGSELCRQIASHKPKQLIIFDIYENNAYSIGLELKEKHPDLNLMVLIGSVRDSRRVNEVFEKYKPEVVYHAAAHKHVPLMEDSPCEAIKNNPAGTYKLAYAAAHNGCKRFVLISTDKAVNPVNIMGASKRICEMIIQAFAKHVAEGRVNEIPALYEHYEEKQDRLMPSEPVPCETQFVAVRFGNVLGSNGSVIPIFKEQISKGGPLTVTHPDVIRYFMTIPEAVSLVLQAGNYAKGGEIFVLDMGTPVKIDDLARNMIKLSGLRPDVDIPIVYTGLRPGEKLYEEKLMMEEGMKTTPNHLIHIGKPIPFDENAFLSQMGSLMNAAYEEDDEEIRSIVGKIVDTYHPAEVEVINEKLEEKIGEPLQRA